MEHLAFYLPFKLKGDYNIYTNKNKTDLFSFETETLTGLNFKDKKIFLTSGCVTEKEDFVPYLRHLSDLTKEIEEIKSIFDKNWCRAYDDFFDALFEHDWLMHTRILMCPYEIIQWFFKNHYDIFGLIEHDLAIDINTLK